MPDVTYEIVQHDGGWAYRVNDVFSDAASIAGSTGSTIEASSFSGLLTRVEIGHIRIGSAGEGRIRSRGSGSCPSQRTKSPGARMTGIRSWMSAISSFESVVMMANVRIHSPEAGSFQFSQIPARPNGEPSFIAIAYGCLALCPLMAFHSKKPSTGTIQRPVR